VAGFFDLGELAGGSAGGFVLADEEGEATGGGLDFFVSAVFAKGDAAGDVADAPVGIIVLLEDGDSGVEFGVIEEVDEEGTEGNFVATEVDFFLHLELEKEDTVVGKGEVAELLAAVDIFLESGFDFERWKRAEGEVLVVEDLLEDGAPGFGTEGLLEGGFDDHGGRKEEEIYLRERTVLRCA